jgi:hypothetical protein
VGKLGSGVDVDVLWIGLEVEGFGVDGQGINVSADSVEETEDVEDVVDDVREMEDVDDLCETNASAIGSRKPSTGTS